MELLKRWFGGGAKERRRSRRFCGPLDLRLITSTRQAVPAELADISEGGLRFRVRRPLSEWQVPVAIYVRAGGRQETLPIEVVRSEDDLLVVAARFLAASFNLLELVGAARQEATRQGRIETTLQRYGLTA